MILDNDPDICGLYPLSKGKEQHYQESIEFISEHTDLFYLQTEEMDCTRFNAATGYEVWHQRLGHVPFRNIEQTIISLQPHFGTALTQTQADFPS